MERLHVSKAYTLANYETVNDKVLREMNERARGIVTTSKDSPSKKDTTGYHYSPPSPSKAPYSSHSRTTSNTSTASIASAAAVAAKSPRVKGHHKRYSSVHRRQFAKMDSIANHYTLNNRAAAAAKQQASPDSKRRAENCGNQLSNSAMKRRRTDAEGGKVDLGLSGVKDKGKALFRRVRKPSGESPSSASAEEKVPKEDNIKGTTLRSTELSQAQVKQPPPHQQSGGGVESSNINTTTNHGRTLRSMKSTSKLKPSKIEEKEEPTRSSTLRSSKSTSRLTSPSKATGLAHSKSTTRGLSSRLTQDTSSSKAKQLPRSKSYATLSSPKKGGNELATMAPQKVENLLNQLPENDHSTEKTSKMLNRLDPPPSKIPAPPKHRPNNTNAKRLASIRSSPNLRKKHF